MNLRSFEREKRGSEMRGERRGERERKEEYLTRKRCVLFCRRS